DGRRRARERGPRRDRPPVHRLRRRRPDRRHAMHDARDPGRDPRPAAGMRATAATAVARAAALASRAAGRGGPGLPGKALLNTAPAAPQGLAAPLRPRIGLSATNGKTTTAAMAASILRRTGARLIHNRAGANMAGGVATALLAADGDTALLEVD